MFFPQGFGFSFSCSNVILHVSKHFNFPKTEKDTHCVRKNSKQNLLKKQRKSYARQPAPAALGYRQHSLRMQNLGHEIFPGHVLQPPQTHLLCRRAACHGEVSYGHPTASPYRSYYICKPHPLAESNLSFFYS